MGETVNIPLVSILCQTYNHENFIQQCIKGFLNQKTNFNFEVLIHEDASTDNTANIIREFEKKFPEIIKPIFQITNQYSQGINSLLEILLPSAQGKYIALCEGDDFWVDQSKLQKQVDFLENNPDYGLVHGDVNHLFENSGKTIYAFNKSNKINIPEGSIFEELMKPSHSIKTMTVCMRRELMFNYYNSYKEIFKTWLLGDLPLWLEVSYNSKVHYFDEVFATYRLSDESASRSKNMLFQHKFHLSVYYVRFYFAEKYNCSKQIKDTLQYYYSQQILKDSILLKDLKMSKAAIFQLIKMKKFGITDFIRFIYLYYIK